MRPLLLVLALVTALLPVPVEAGNARCVIRQNGAIAYAGSCRFLPDTGGSFSIRRHDSPTILPDITDITVSVVTRGVAEVRGLTIDGIHSRWGRAWRSGTDPACWKGADFEICAY